MLCTNGTECLTCDPTKLRVYDGTTKLCSCKGGYYEDSLTHLCTLCNYKCLNCLDENRCSSCPYNRIQNLIDNTCNCPDGTFDNGGSAVCLSCDVRCLTCTSATTCSSCLTSNFR